MQTCALHASKLAFRLPQLDLMLNLTPACHAPVQQVSLYHSFSGSVSKHVSRVRPSQGTYDTTIQQLPDVLDVRQHGIVGRNLDVGGSASIKHTHSVNDGNHRCTVSTILPEAPCSSDGAVSGGKFTQHLDKQDTSVNRITHTHQAALH